MITLKQKATKFRNAIYRAKKHGDLDWHSTFSKFPDDCCDMTCDLLGQYLLSYRLAVSSKTSTEYVETILQKYA